MRKTSLIQKQKMKYIAPKLKNKKIQIYTLWRGTNMQINDMLLATETSQ